MRKNYPLFLLLLLAGLLLSFQLNKPFVGHHDWNGAFWGSMAREYLRGHFSYFSHYTPFLPLLLSLSGLVFGIHEWSLRLVTVCFSLAMLLAMYRIGEFLYGRMAGIVAMAFAMATPMFLYFGKLPDHEPIATSLIVIAFYFYLKLKSEERRTQYAFLGTATLAFLESWAAYFFIPFLLLHSALFEKKRLPTVLRGAAIGVVVAILHATFLYMFNGPEGLTNFLRAGAFRLNFDASAKNVNRFTWPQFAVTEARYSAIYFTRILLVLTAAWIVLMVRSLWRGKRPSDAALLVLLLSGASFIVVFSNLAYIHDYKLYLLLPFVALAAAAVMVSMVKMVKRRASRLAARAFLLLVVSGVATERLPYVRALLATSFNAPGYRLGLLINRKTDPGERVFVDSTEFASFYEVFVTYYADRPVSFGDMTINQFQQQKEEYQLYRYLVLIKDRPTDAALAQYLSQVYQSETAGDFTFLR